MNKNDSHRYYTQIDTDELLNLLKMRLKSIQDSAESILLHMESVKSTLPYSMKNAEILEKATDDLHSETFHVHDLADSFYKELKEQEEEERECTSTID